MQTGLQLLSVAGVELELWVSGSGPPLLFLHGGDGVERPEEFIDYLRGDFQVLTSSHPGFGRSSIPEHYSDVSDLGFFYLDLMRQLDLRDVLLVGVSFGAWIAADIAIKSQSRIRGLVLAGALGAKFSDPRTREIRDLFAMPRSEMDQWLVSREELKTVDRSGWSNDALLRGARNHESFALFGWAPTLYDPKLKHRLHRIDVPTQLIWGEQDQVVSVDYGRQLAACLPAAAFVTIPIAGHYVHRDDPKAFAAAIDTFAAQIRTKD